MLRVDEAATRVSLDAGQGKVSLAVENLAARPILAQITLELLDPQDKVVTQTRRRETVKPGASVIAAFLPVAAAASNNADPKQILWYRLRYRVGADIPEAFKLADSSPDEGIISLSEITPDLFELNVSAASKAQAGQLYRVRVRAAHPVSSRPVGGVELAGELVFDEAEEGGALKLNGMTDKDGYAALDFKLPARVASGEGEIKLTARRGDVVQTASEDFELDDAQRILLTSDKPLYQPGQTLHLRALLLDHATRRALSDAAVTLKIEDPEGTTLFTTTLKTSRFGIASVDWPIPENTRLGDYSVRVEADDGDSSDGAAYLRVKISRYELPNFTVTATPDRGYYLPGESAQVEVRGDYLFGQPLKRGRVRVVRESERKWNYKEQKYESEEGEKYEGELADDGRFLVRINLTNEHAHLADSSWQRFADLTYAAYVTDPATNRTEQRRFSLRLTRQQIHVYVTHGNYRQAEGLPLTFFVSTSYADGTPASCEVRLAQKIAARQNAQVLRMIKTNAYGVAKVSELKLPDDNDMSVLMSAHDRDGRTGEHVEDFWRTSDPVIRIETDKTIYRAGEPITVQFTSNAENPRIIIDVISNNRVVMTETVRLRGGSSQLTLPYRREFQNRVTLAAYGTDFPDNNYEDDYARGTRTVIYPRNRELKLDVQMSRASYQPGEEATAGVRVRSASGASVESALGVVVFDKAVEERARTEQDFGSSYGFSNYFYGFWYGSESIGGITLRNVEQLNPARALPAGLEIVADLLLQRDNENYRPNFFGSADYETSQSRVFAALAASHLKRATDALNAREARTMQHPSDEASLRRLLAIDDIALDDLRDPWGTPYRPVFGVERANDLLTFKSAGADKKFGTEDDWQAARLAWPYFRREGEAMARAVSEYHGRTGGFVRDFATLRDELKSAGLDLDSVRDRWGKPYEFRFGVSGTNYTIDVVSGGENGRVEPKEQGYSPDDFSVWMIWTDYFAATRSRLDTALAAYLKAEGNFPRDVAALAELFGRIGLSPAHLKDPWQRPYYLTARTETRYVDRVRIESGRAVTAQPANSAPVSQQLEFMILRSAGLDGRTGTSDDFTVAEFSRIVAGQSAHDAKPLAAPAVTIFSGATGAISGTVFDPNGAVIPGMAVTAARHNDTQRTFKAVTDEEGRFLLRNLPAGFYTVRVDESAGFQQMVVMGVQVQSSTLTTVDFTLAVGSPMSVVDVIGLDGVAIDPTELAVQTNITSQTVEKLPKGESFSSLLKEGGQQQGAAMPPVQTPRLRKDFPETLYWQPAVETDARGRTELRFKLADNITTWKMSLIGSTETGELGTVEHEIRAFQPFFVEHDPPRVLTEGDEINLPVVVRNYLDRAQPVALDIKTEDWFTLLGPARKQTQVAAGDAARETFDFRAVASVREGLQRITATGGDASDQIEKPVHVHPDGEEFAETTTQILRTASALEVVVPAHAVPRTARAELKIYPNLSAHAVESIEAIMARPYGCAEQTISSAYPSLLVLRHQRRTGDAVRERAPAAAKASRYLHAGYERLLSYRADAGGFSYWGRGEPDLALTAYAVRFLTDAGEFTSVDANVLAGARDWLIRRQHADGSWTDYEYEKTSNTLRTAMVTAYIARVLAMQPRAAKPQAQEGRAQAETKTAASLARALAYLAPRIEETDEPYMIASYALAAIDGGEAKDRIARAVSKLRSLAREEAGGAYWALETNTPFYGWGRAGRIETTALAVQALTRGEGAVARAAAKTEGARLRDEKAAISTSPASSSSTAAQISSGELVDRGLLFLLKNKDRYGVWFSTQATVNVLDALEALASSAGGAGAREGKPTAAQPVGDGERVEVFVNGQSAAVFVLPGARQIAHPLSVDLSHLLGMGANRVELRRAAGADAAAAQLVTTYYRAWEHAGTDGALATRPHDSRSLRLKVAFDRTTAATGDTVTCSVEAERVGHHGYGMLLAEVGLPPGADVDRASLERAMKESGWEFSHYDLLPDRLVAYLWPRAGGTHFQFTFRPRYGLAAKSAPSVVYDYYNPEARAVLAPTKFIVKDPQKPAPPAQARLK